MNTPVANFAPIVAGPQDRVEDCIDVLLTHFEEEIREAKQSHYRLIQGTQKPRGLNDKPRPLTQIESDLEYACTNGANVP